jgi:co-chaperonin GroES (HSP10)
LKGTPSRFSFFQEVSVVALIPRALDFVPLRDIVLFEEIPPGMTSGGIAAPNQPMMPRGRVVAVGPAVSGIVVGDVVYLISVGGQIPAFQYDGRKFGFLPESMVIFKSPKPS